MDALTRKCRDGTLPKMVGRNIGLHHADLPWARKLLPYLVCYLGSDSTPPASAKDEEFSHIPDSQIGGDFRPTLHENEPCQVSTLFYKKRKSARFAPIKWEKGIAEPASTIHLQTVEFAKIVRVQLQEIRERRLLFRGGGDHFDIRGQPLRRLGHSSGRDLHSQYVTAPELPRGTPSFSLSQVWGPHQSAPGFSPRRMNSPAALCTHEKSNLCLHGSV